MWNNIVSNLKLVKFTRVPTMTQEKKLILHTHTAQQSERDFLYDMPPTIRSDLGTFKKKNSEQLSEGD